MGASHQRYDTSMYLPLSPIIHTSEFLIMPRAFLYPELADCRTWYLAYVPAM